MYKRAQLGIGYLAQEASIFRSMTVEDNILCVLEMTTLSKKERVQKCENLLNEFGLTIYLRKKPEKLYNFLIKNNCDRPIFNSFKTIEDFFNNFNYRERFYLKSKVTIDCDNLSNMQILTKINNHYNENRFKK